MAGSAAGDFWLEAAKAIMTTDTFPRSPPPRRRSAIRCHHQWHCQRRRHDCAGYGDDAVVHRHRCRHCCARCLAGDVEESRRADFQFGHCRFSDTSTSDTLLLFATGRCRRAQRQSRDTNDKRLGAFKRALGKVLKDLALQVVRDGEGARKMIEVSVTGAKSAKSAKRIALSIANSPLVKTAVAGEDANWGRVVMAVGKAGEPADRDRLSIWFGKNRLAHRRRARSGLFGGQDIRLHEAGSHCHPRRSWHWPRQGNGLDL